MQFRFYLFHQIEFWQNHTKSTEQRGNENWCLKMISSFKLMRFWPIRTNRRKKLSKFYFMRCRPRETCTFTFTHLISWCMQLCVVSLLIPSIKKSARISCIYILCVHPIKYHHFNSDFQMAISLDEMEIVFVTSKFMDNTFTNAAYKCANIRATDENNNKKWGEMCWMEIQRLLNRFSTDNTRIIEEEDRVRVQQEHKLLVYSVFLYRC